MFAHEAPSMFSTVCYMAIAEAWPLFTLCISLTNNELKSSFLKVTLLFLL